MKVRQIASVAALALLVPSAAHAQSAAPPGSAAVDQYREQAPPAGPGGSKLSKDRRRELESRGPDGRALADALDRNGGVPSSDPVPASGAGGTAAGSGAADGGTSRDRAAVGRGDGAPAGSGGGGASVAGGAPEGDAAGGRAGADGAGTRTTSLAESSATSTVGGLPVWGLLVGALAIVGVGAIVRGRRAS